VMANPASARVTHGGHRALQLAGDVYRTAGASTRLR
jgi:hypothetical protein